MMKLSEIARRSKLALAVLRDGETALVEDAKRRAVDDFLKNAGLKIPGAWNPVESVEQYRNMSEAIGRSRGRKERIQKLRETYAEEDGKVCGIAVGLIEEAAVALTINGIKPPAELTDRLFEQYAKTFVDLARYLYDRKNK